MTAVAAEIPIIRVAVYVVLWKCLPERERRGFIKS